MQALVLPVNNLLTTTALERAIQDYQGFFFVVKQSTIKVLVHTSLFRLE